MENTIFNNDSFLVVEKQGEYFIFAKKQDAFGTKYLASKGSVKEQPEMDEFASLVLNLLKHIDKK